MLYADDASDLFHALTLLPLQSIQYSFQRTKRFAKNFRKISHFAKILGKTIGVEAVFCLF